MATTIKSRKKNQQKPVPTLLQAIEKVVNPQDCLYTKKS